MKINVIILTLGLLFQNCQSPITKITADNAGYNSLQLKTNNGTINKAFRIALGDYFTNIQPYRIDIVDTTSPVIMAGLEYGRPWTRDASINSWSAGSFITPEIARNTLLSVLKNVNDTIRIGGQYWDAIIWVTSAWNHYLTTGDKSFLKLAYEVTLNSLTYSERTEFDENYNLFRGLGWSDGVAAYEGKYAETGGSSAAYDWPKHNPDKVSKPGYGIPMMATSTNSLYYNAYKLANKMAKELHMDTLNWSQKASKLKMAINNHLWNDSTGVYKFYIDADEESNLQETVGNAYAILFGIADERQASSIFQNQHVTPAGVPCGWPPLDRYRIDSLSYSRHNAVVWPQIQGIWVHAASKYYQPEIIFSELNNLANHAVRDMQFVEIYHPNTGEKYGGIQEKNGEYVEWEATNRQTWSATALIGMVIYGIIGIEIDEQFIRLTPNIPKAIDNVHLTNLKIRNMFLNISITGKGSQISKIIINGNEVQKAYISINAHGNNSIEIQMK